MKTINIKGKEYVTVSERVKALRNKYGFEVSIITEILHINESEVVIKATLKKGDIIISTGIAKEEKDNTYINKGSHIENCETSAVGRCLAFAGFGIDAEIASADELINLDKNNLITDTQVTTIDNLLHECTLDDKIKARIEKEIDTMTYSRANDCIEYLTNNLPDQIESGRNYQQKDIMKKLDAKLNDPRS